MTHDAFNDDGREGASSPAAHRGMLRAPRPGAAACEPALPDREPRRHLYDLIPRYLSRAGKGLRPALCIATCRAFGGDREARCRSAVALELLHNAFLVHDDIEDGSEHRRGQPTMHVDHGVPLAVNAGDAMNALSVRPLRGQPSAAGAGGWPGGSSTSSSTC